MIQIHILTDVKELHRKVDVSQLPLAGGGYMAYSHEEFAKFVKVRCNLYQSVSHLASLCWLPLAAFLKFC